MSAADPFESFEHHLAAALERVDDPVNRRLMREHFALDQPHAARGKRLRPRLLLAAAQAEGAAGAHVWGAATAVELLHNFSLIHDDIEDRDELRHGRPTLWVRFGIPAALGAGDAMCALGYVTLLDGCEGLEPARIAAMARCLLHAQHRMTQGQAFDIAFERAGTVAFEQYLTMIEGKTAAVFGAACELGALAAGASEERAAAYGAAGRAYGMAFQVRDDVLGSWGLTAQTGKPSGADIRRRKWSFPVAWAMSREPDARRAVVSRAYEGGGELDERSAAEVLEALEALGARDAADDACARWIAHAKSLARTHALDRSGGLAALFDAAASRPA